MLFLAWKNNRCVRPDGTPFFGHLSRNLPPMASIERTAYPRFKPSLSTHEFHALYCPTDEERDFILTHAREDAQ